MNDLTGGDNTDTTAILIQNQVPSGTGTAKGIVIESDTIGLEFGIGKDTLINYDGTNLILDLQKQPHQGVNGKVSFSYLLIYNLYLLIKKSKIP